MAYRFLMGKLEWKRPLGDLGVNGCIILGWICTKCYVGMWTGLGRTRIGTGIFMIVIVAVDFSVTIYLNLVKSQAAVKQYQLLYLLLNFTFRLL